MKTISRRLRTGLLFTAGMFASLASSAQTVTLSYNPKAGTKYKTTMNTTLEMNMEVGGMPVANNMSMAYYTTQKISKGEGKSKTVSVNYDRVVVSGSGMGNEMSYDSDKQEDAGSELAAAGSIVNKPITMTVAPDEKISDVTGLDPVLEGQSGALTAETVQQMMQQSMYVFPQKPVKPGDTWVRDATNAVSGVEMTSHNTYKLESVTGGIATVSLTSVITGNNAEGNEAMQMSLNGTQTGSFRMDVASGLVLEMNVAQDISGDLVTGGNTIPVTIKSKNQITGKIN